MIKYLAALFFVFATPALADVRLPKIYSSHMVLQQNADTKIWGWGDPDETIHITCDWIDGQLTTVADTDGRWDVQFRTGPAGKPHTIKITGKNTILLEDVLFGEVWLASGQSNMEMPLVKVSGAYTGIKDAAQEVASAKFPEIRLFQVGNFSSREPLDDVQPGIKMYGIPPAKCTWQACSPDSISTFSSTAYFFARELHRELKVPIGIIDASWGGTSAETWTPAEGLKKLGYTKELGQAASLPQKADQKIPTRLYNGMIHPLRFLTIKGAIWYQGEGNASRADKYRQLFSTMITEWRTSFGREFPFYFVQIAPFNYRMNAAFLREAQLETMSLAQTGMAVTMDIGNLKDIHPKNKQEVGRRLALWALANDYERKELVHSGPVYKEFQIEGGKMRLRFDHVGSGLATRDDKPLSHFEIAGSDGVFHPATATIDGDDVLVSSEKVAEPQAVRYAFTSRATPNLMNSEGLPASSFRTDR